MIRYYHDGNKSNVQSTKEDTDTSGWAWYIGETVDGWYTGQAKLFCNDGRVFNGEWEKNMRKGEMSYVQADGSRIIKHETYDAQSDTDNEIACWDQKPVQSVGDNKRVANEEYDKLLLASPQLK